jgi:hypothetical protein
MALGVIVNRCIISKLLLRMDIFNSTPRVKEDTIKSPLNYPEASITERKLQEDH